MRKSLKELLRQEEVAVKICGVTNSDEAHEIIRIGADLLGLNFYPKSKRFLGAPGDHPWVKELPISRVGIFVNESIDRILKLWGEGWIDVAQLHGDEPTSEVLELKGAGLPVIKAVGLNTTETIDDLPAFGADAILLDAPAAGERGGTGRTIDWRLAREAVERCPDLPMILAGGLRDENVSEAVHIVRPAGVDVASGVEVSPGRKDLDQVKRFIAAAREG